MSNDNQNPQSNTVITLALTPEKYAELGTCFRAEKELVQEEIAKRAKQNKRTNEQEYANFLFQAKLAEVYKPAKNRILSIYREAYKTAVARGADPEAARKMFGLDESDLVESQNLPTRGVAKKLAILASL